MFRNQKTFLESIRTIYRMDRGDRIYVKRHFRRGLYVTEILEAFQEKSGAMKILDVGCGSGFFMLMTGGGVTGLDNAENVEVCKKRGLQAYSVNLEKDRFPFESNVFDAAVCLEVLEHLTDPKNVFDEIHRLLSSGGYLIVSTPNSRIPTWRIRDFLFKFKFISQIYINREISEDEKRYGKGELEQLLSAHNFEGCS